MGQERRSHVPERDAEDHKDGAGALNEHHGNAECADEAKAIGVHELRCILECRKQRGGDAEEGCPE